PLGEQSLQSPYPALRNTSSDCSGSNPYNYHLRRFTPPPPAEDKNDALRLSGTRDLQVMT
ncbi:MAG: hypothetical protein PHN98_00875, partial [Smithellaceae bacterium]|nr:hypothetical protein [Smithellaceae bacterium]